jgi:4-amino-4-deoxy-L-arabinose transferase-like glycosyltransferase
MGKGGLLRRLDWCLALILAGAFALRLASAISAPYLEPIETVEIIPCAQRISWDYLPIREYQHAALPAYLVKASGALFGESRVGFRMLDVVAGLGIIVIIYRLGLEWWGRGPARWAALLLAVNEYHVAISARAIDLVFDLLFVALAMYGFARFLKTERPGWLYLAGVAAGLGFLCKEITCLMLPVFFITLLSLPLRRWLLRKEPWLAALLFFVVISPDICYNLCTPVETQLPQYANYRDHLSRCGGLGLSLQPCIFYFREAFQWMGIPGRDGSNSWIEYHFPEMPCMNPAFGILLCMGVILVTLRKHKDSATVFCLVMFWGIFTFFSLIAPQMPTSRPNLDMDPAVEYWVDRTSLPAALLTGLVISPGLGRIWVKIRTWVRAADQGPH